jgi:polysaccharide pyruvyl transferase WcaK-like protein
VNKNKILIIVPTFALGNIGDLAVVKTCEFLLKSNGRDFHVVTSIDEKVNLRDFKSLIIFGNDILAYYQGFSQTGKFVDSFLNQKKSVFVLNCSWGPDASKNCLEPYKNHKNFYIYFRDQYSLEIFNKNFNFFNKPKLCADIAHLCPKDEKINDLDLVNWINSSDKKIIGINIHKDFKHYNQDVWEMYKKTILHYSKDYKFLMIPHDSRSHVKEKKLHHQLASECHSCDFFVTDYLDPSQEKIISENLHFLIAGRMHLSILTITQGVPCIAIEYNGVKALGTLSHWGIGNFTLKASEIDNLIALSNEVIDKYSTIQKTINAKNDTVKKLSSIPINDILFQDEQ